MVKEIVLLLKWLKRSRFHLLNSVSHCMVKEQLVRYRFPKETKENSWVQNFCSHFVQFAVAESTLDARHLPTRTGGFQYPSPYSSVILGISQSFHKISKEDYFL